ncbi:DUF6444 domain-containing protein [Actinomadura sp. 6N118]|uniref:DUF6444 domain-containing protein n=1 Tax=Actinomadura sp. 6N118 TaxID=3375151 RepID=UPI00379FBF24
MEEQNAALRRQVGLDSTNSSTPPSADSIGAKAKRHKANSQRERSKDRKPGGQRGHPGSGLEFAPVSELADTVPVEPAECSTCGECLDSNAPGEGFTPVQQWDVPPVTLRKVQFDLMRRRCSAGHLTQAPAPAGVSGPVCYGPNVRAFAARQLPVRGQYSVGRGLGFQAGHLLGNRCPFGHTLPRVVSTSALAVPHGQLRARTSSSLVPTVA